MFWCFILPIMLGVGGVAAIGTGIATAVSGGDGSGDAVVSMGQYALDVAASGILI